MHFPYQRTQNRLITFFLTTILIRRNRVNKKSKGRVGAPLAGALPEAPRNGQAQGLPLRHKRLKNLL